VGLQTWYGQILMRIQNLQNKMSVTIDADNRRSIADAIYGLNKWKYAMEENPECKAITTQYRERPEAY
jgi:hypothetical protein